jgi:pimeloyl-ACP methyl ester carboxylesterase
MFPTLRIATFSGSEARVKTWLFFVSANFILCHPLVTNASQPRVEDVAFTAALDGSEQRYMLVYPAGFEERSPRDVVIALHGHGSDRRQFAEGPIAEARAVRDVAAKRGMLLVSPDYRAATSWMGPAAEADMVQIIDELKKRFAIRRVYVCGASMGGASCLTFAALHPELVDGVASMNGLANHFGYERFQAEIGASFGGGKADVPEEYKRRSAEYWPERLTMPVAITVGGKDDGVPPASVLRLGAVLERLQDDVLVINRPETGHTTSYEDAAAALEFVIERAERRAASHAGEKQSGLRE